MKLRLTTYFYLLKAYGNLKDKKVETIKKRHNDLVKEVEHESNIKSWEKKMRYRN